MSLERVGNGVDFDRSLFKRDRYLLKEKKKIEDGVRNYYTACSFPNGSLPHT